MTAHGSDVPDAPAFRVVVEHAVLVVPDDVGGRLAHDLLHDAFQLDRAAALVELLAHRLVSLVHNLDLRNWNKKEKEGNE